MKRNLTKIFILCLLIASCFLLVSCGNDKDSNPTPEQTPVEPTPEQTPVDPNPGQTPVDPNPGETPVEPNPGETPVEPNPGETPVDPTPNPTVPPETGGNGGEDTDGDEEQVTAIDAVLYFHYRRNDANYNRWQIWLWAEEGDALDPIEIDSFGAVFRVDLNDKSSFFYQQTEFGYIYRLGEWEAKDKVANDRFVTITEAMVDENNEIHLYSFEGVETIFLDKDQKQPVYEINGFVLGTDGTTVTVSANTTGQSFSVYRNGEVFIKDRNFKISNTATIQLPEKFDLAKKDVYELEINFDNEVILKTDLNISNYYNSSEFINNYIYNGNDLGVTVKDGKTTFKLWAPASRAVTVDLYRQGHPTKLGTTDYPGQNKPTKSYEMTLGAKGVWTVTVDEDLTGYYYNYSVTNGYTTTSEVVDPYAYATGLNGLRGYIVDFSKLNPEGWDYNRKSLYTPNELVVYELHIRDLTMDDTWNGTEAYRGKYLGMSETGTTFTYGDKTVTTGFDHIKELGVNAVQILPFFDASNKEQREDQYNWGYNPQNYNVLEGQYSTNPYDAETRIVEFKQMMKAYNDAGIEIIMDVVYNHMSGITGSSFHKILPGYYFRYDDRGIAWNGSGCGNEVASNRAMVRKYIIDSITFWAKEYNIKGFRFDLMALLDITTMNQLANELHKIDPNIAVYGEPWDAVGGSGSFAHSDKANTANASKLNGVGMFNDHTRNKINGEPGNSSKGWVQGAGSASELVSGLQGTHIDPTKQVNYITCHDNYALADKMRMSGVSESDLGKAVVTSTSVVLASQGITFIHAGEEILRSKPIYKNGIWTGEYSHNSYNLPDASNSLKWEDKIRYADAYEAYKDMVQMAVNQSAFHYSSKSQTQQYVQVKQANDNSIVLEITTQNKDANDWSKVVVIISNAKGGTSYNVSGSWNVYTVSGTSNVTKGGTATGQVTAGAYSTVVLYQN